MSFELVRVALVGIGWWSGPVGGAAKDCPKIDLVSCYTRTPEKRAAFAEAHGCAEAESYEAILEDPSIEGVLITSSNKAHQAQVEAAFRAGKHVWVEKPITTALATTRPVLQAWRASGKVLSVGHCYRRAAGHRKMKALIEEGAVGRPLQAEAYWATWTGQKFTPEKWHYYREECPGGPLTQLGIHHADTLHYLLGEPVRIMGMHRKLATPAEIDDVTATLVEHAGGAVSSIGCGFCSPNVYSLRLHGTEGVLFMQIQRTDITNVGATDAQTTLTFQKVGKAEAEPVALPGLPHMVYSEIEEFAVCVREGKAPETGPREAALALAVVEGSVISSERGVAVDVEELLDGMEI